MQYRKFAQTDVKLSSMGLGCMGMSEFYGATNDEDSNKLIKRAYELGINFFDTADIYGYGHNEDLIGDCVKDFRKNIVIATKCGLLRKKEDPTFRGINCRPDYIKEACEKSLRRLKTDYIDLYYLHRTDPNVPIEESIDALSTLVKSGKILYIGLSEANSEIIQRAHKVHPISAIQSEYSLWSRDPEQNKILDICKELKICFVPYSPLGRGFLTGKINSNSEISPDDFRKNHPRFIEENLEQNKKLLEILRTIANQMKCTTGQISLAWVLAQGENIIPIPGTKRIKYLEENIKSIEVLLDKEILKEISNSFPFDVACGSRYFNWQLQMPGIEHKKSQ